MRLKSIDFDKNELPKRVTLKVSPQELWFISAYGLAGNLEALKVLRKGMISLEIAHAAALAHYVGGLSAATSPNHECSSEIFDCLTGAVFNRYWDDGIPTF